MAVTTVRQQALYATRPTSSGAQRASEATRQPYVARPPSVEARHASEIRRHALKTLIRHTEAPDGTLVETIDWSPWYLTEEEDVGQSGEHGKIIEVLHSSLRILASERDWSSTLVAYDNFFAWVEDEYNVQVSPDIYLIDDPPPTDVPLPTRWEVWKAGHRPPRFAVEIVSSEWKKDYEINPPRYDHLGVDELVIADQQAVFRDLSARGRAPFSVYRRAGEADSEAELKLVYRGNGPVYCAEIDAYLCFRWDTPGRPRVRVSLDPEGRDVVPTAMEKTARQAEKLDAQAEKLDAQAAEIAALRARLPVVE